MIYRFGDYELDTNRHELRAKGEPQALEPQVFRLLMVLIENSNRVVTRDELMDTIWQGRLVSDSALVSRIRSARQAIGDSGEHQTFIQTVRGCGYRFVGSPIAESEVSFQTATSRKPSAVAESRLLPVLTTRVLAQFDRIWSSLAIGTERLGWLVILLLLIGIGMGMGVWRFLPSSAPPRAVADPSIAVLPFADLSEAGDQEFFAAGVAEEILNTLIKVKDLRVVGRNSSFPFKAKNVDVKTIGEQLNVTAVLAGSVRRSQDRVRITVQLVDTASGYHLWSETYDRKMQDIFAMQDEIAQAVAHRLHIELGDEDPERPLVSQETDDLEAYRLYLQGRYLWKRRDGNNIPQAIKFFEETIARDTDFARAHSALAAAYTVLPTYTKANRSESFEAAERAAHTALRLNPELSEPHAVLGRLYSKRSQWRRAERQFRHAVALDPEDPVTRFWYGIHSISVGRLQEALTHYEKALSIDPAWGLAVCLHSEALYALGQPEAAIQGAERAVALGCRYCEHLLGLVAYEKGLLNKAIHHFINYKRLLGVSEARLKKSRRAYEAMLGLTGSQSVFLQNTERLLQSGQISQRTAFYQFYHSKHVDRATKLFDIKAQPKFLNFLRRVWGPYGRPFRTHPQFATIATKLDLINFWREFGWPNHCGPDPKNGIRCN